MIKNTLIIALIILAIYLYYQNKKLQQLPHSGNTTETIFELDEDKEDLIAEKDAALRSKNEAEQEVLSLNNRLKLKQQEVTRKETEIERLKKEKSQSEISLNGKLSERKKELEELKKKYSERSKQLDEEQLENNKLEAENQKLQEQLTELTNSKSPLPGTFPEEKEGVYSELSQDKQELEKTHQEQLRKIYALFDLRAKGMKEIDFSQLYGLLQKISKKVDLAKISK
jgi:chromosome segregation ATPase